MSEQTKFENYIENIFRIDSARPDCLISRESTTVEFKANFTRNKKTWCHYGKTIAAFSNAKGGCLVFGVSNNPRKLVGMTNTHFENLDPEEFTKFLNEKFSPEIHWEIYIHRIDDKSFGLLSVEESFSKPVMAKTNGGDHIFESEIYYRYRGRSEKIKYPELRSILEEQRKREQELWMNHLQRIASVGVSNAAIFNPNDGTVTGKGGTFVIDKQLLPKLNFIREGEFKEVTGAPTIKLVGEAQVLAAGEVKATEVIERKAIRLNEIIEFFLLQKNPDNPTFFIEQACYEQTGFLPIYYFADMAELTLQEIIDLASLQSSSNPGKRKLLERLNERDEKLYQDIPNTSSASAKIKRKIKLDFLDKTLKDSIDMKDAQYRLEVVRSFRKEDIDIDYFFPEVHKLYVRFWKEGGIIRTYLYKAICHLDREIFCTDGFYSDYQIQEAMK